MDEYMWWGYSDEVIVDAWGPEMLDLFHPIRTEEMAVRYAEMFPYDIVFCAKLVMPL